MRREATAALARVRRLCLALPETSERPSHGAPSFYIAGRHQFAMFHDDHHGDGRVAIWCAAPAGAQAGLVGAAPERYFVPAYVGHLGWLGMRLDGDPDWDEVAGVLEDAYLTRAPRRLAAAIAPLTQDAPRRRRRPASESSA